MDAGLEQVVAAETVLSDVDGERGRLIVRGASLEALAGKASFEDLIHLLWSGFVDDLPALQDMPAALAAARVATFAKLSRDAEDLAPLGCIEALRAGLARLRDGDDCSVALELVAGSAVQTAAIVRAQSGLALVPPDPKLGHAADLLRMMRGAPASDAEAAALDCYLVTVADHGLNASTFTARVVASTHAGLGSACIAGLSALKGPLHGGAPGPVLDMIDGIGVPENAEAWIGAALARGERLMGFGHRVYRVRDPRADALKRAVSRLPKTTGRLAFAEAIERVALSSLARRYPDRKLETNVEFYTALLLEALAMPRGAFTSIFSCGRIVGWIAHAREQVATKRLIRPRSVYVGPTPKVAA